VMGTAPCHLDRYQPFKFKVRSWLRNRSGEKMLHLFMKTALMITLIKSILAFAIPWSCHEELAF